MSRIEKRFRELKSSGRKGLVPFISAGDPSLARTEELLDILARAGADVIELGIPFSDPMADGPTIQAASERALKNDFGIEDILGLVARFRKKHDTPVLLFGYYNPVMSFGEERLVSESQEAGADGFLVVDLPPEEGGELRRMAKTAGLDVIYLVAPTTPDERIAKICKSASGFIYYVAVTGVTGAREALSDAIPADVKRIRAHTGLPVAVGFGISTPEQAAQVAAHADAAVVGSAIVSLIGKHGDTDEMVAEVDRFVRALRKGLDSIAG